MVWSGKRSEGGEEIEGDACKEGKQESELQISHRVCACMCMCVLCVGQEILCSRKGKSSFPNSPSRDKTRDTVHFLIFTNNDTNCNIWVPSRWFSAAGFFLWSAREDSCYCILFLLVLSTNITKLIEFHCFFLFGYIGENCVLVKT